MNYADVADLDPTMLVEGQPYTVMLRHDGASVPVDFEYSARDLAAARERVILRNRDKLGVLQQLHRYPAVFRLLDARQTGDDLARLETALADVFTAPREVYIFGAHRIGARVARFCAERGHTVKGFLDNDRNKHGLLFEGVPVLGADDVRIENEVVVVGSGRYSNAILRQIAGAGWPTVLNLHEALFALRAPHCAEDDFRRFSAVLGDDAYRLISAFLELDDERSREVFNGLIEMRATLDTRGADAFKSPFDDEYLDTAFIEASDIAYYVDAGSYTGDTLERFEKRFGPVTHAYMFEPELPAYYEGVKKFAARNDVFFYNFGLSSQYEKFVYRPALSCDVFRQIDNPVPNDITSFIQAVRLDDVLTGKVTLFKLDIEGAEESALRGASHAIRTQHPKLCVCAYHRADDLWKLIDAVKRIDASYKVGLRHYADVMEDTSLYFY